MDDDDADEKNEEKCHKKEERTGHYATGKVVDI